MLVYLLMAIARAISALNLRMAELIHVGPLSEWQIQSLGAASVWQQIWPYTRLNPVFAEAKFSDCH